MNASSLQRNVLARGFLTVAVMIGLTSLASSQDQSAGTAKDTIFARKVLKGAVDNNMNELVGVIELGRPIDLDDARGHADHISVLLLAFPHMFPPGTNQWTAGAARDAATDTFAAPEIWTNFADFYKIANEAADIAFRASRATTEAELRVRIRELDRACDGCHDKYQKSQ
jgi:cytochrome c556